MVLSFAAVRFAKVPVMLLIVILLLAGILRAVISALRKGR